jgi:Ca2+-binding EF-hand superfamily protein
MAKAATTKGGASKEEAKRIEKEEAALNELLKQE